MASKSLSATIFGIDKASPVFDQVGRNADEMAGDVEQSGSKIGDAFSKGAKIAAGAIAAIGFADFVRDTIAQASNLEQNVGAVQAVFKDTSDEIMQFGSTSAETVGIAKQDYLQLAATFGSQLKNMGVASDQLAPKTNKLVTLGADLAAVYGGTAADAVDAISSLLRGERDPIERYGVSIKQASINAYELANHLDTSTAQAKTNADMQATLALLFQQTADAQGQFAEQTDTLAESQQIANAKFAEAKAEIGQKLLPIVTDFTNFAGDNLVPILGTVADVLGDAINVIDGIPGPVKIALAALLGFKLFQQTQVFSKLATGLRGFRDEMALQQGFAKMEGQQLSTMGAAATVAKTKIGGLAKSFAVGGLLAGAPILIGAIVSGFQDVAKQQQEVVDGQHDIADALTASNGKWTEQVQLAQNSAIEQTDFFKAATNAGIPYKDIMLGLTGTQKDWNKLQQEALKTGDYDVWRTLRQSAALRGQRKASVDLYNQQQQTLKIQKQENEAREESAERAEAEKSGYVDMTSASRNYVSQLMQQHGESGKVTDAQAKQKEAYYDSADAAQTLYLKYAEGDKAAAEASSSARDLAGKLQNMATAEKQARDKAHDLINAASQLEAEMDRLSGRTPKVSDATRAWNGAMQDAIDSAKDADGKVRKLGSGILKASGEIKTGTRAGAQLYDTVTGLAKAARDQALAQAEVAGKARGQRAAEQALTKSLSKSRQEFVHNAHQMGLTAKQAQKLADRYFGIPSKVKTVISGDFTDVTNKLQRLADNTVHVKVQGQYIGTSGAPTRSFSSAMGFAASGGPVHPGRYVVGEDGYEVLDLYPGGGGYVHPHSDAVRLLAGAANIGARASGGPVVAPRPLPAAAAGNVEVTVLVPGGFVGSPTQLADALAAPLADAVARGRRNGKIRAGAFA